MKVLICANVPFTISNYRFEFVSKLLQEGHQVFLVYGENGSKSGIEGVIEFTIPLSRSGMNPLSEFRTIFNLFKIYRRVRPNIVMNYTIKATIYSSIVCGIIGIKSCFSNITGIGTIFISEGFYSRLIKHLVILQMKVAFLFNKYVFFQNVDDETLFNELGLLERSQCRLINGSGVNLCKFSGGNRTFVSPRKAIFVGRLLRDKGIFELVDAAKRVYRKYPDFVLTLVGSTDDNKSSLNKSQVDRLNNEPYLNFVGASNSVSQHLLENGLFILPSYREGTPRSTLEAMACNLPIITTDVPGCRETVVEGFNGFLVPVKDAVYLADRIIWMIENEDSAKKFGENSYKIVEERFDVNKVNQAIYDFVFEDGEAKNTTAHIPS